MLYYNFGDYEGFKKRFGIVRDKNGKLIRKNKILLSYVKNKELFKWTMYYVGGCGDISKSFINARNLSTVEKHIKSCLMSQCGRYFINIMGYYFCSPIYATDEWNGMPEDGSIGFVRYKDMKRGGKVYNMKIGKMIRHLLDYMKSSRLFSEEAKIYFCEVMKEEWLAYQENLNPDGGVVVDTDFRFIYNSSSYAGEIESCMTNDGFHTFYNLVDAHAASLRNKEGKILSRCIIFDKVHVSDTGEVLRLAERQYSVDNNPVYSRMLIDRLIGGGYIDGFKKIGAGCHDAHSFVMNNGELIYGDLSISANLDADDVVSYQDSFKSYDPKTHKLYNYEKTRYSLEVTDGVMEGTEYDEYHQRRTFNDILQCHYDGSWIDVDEECLDDFMLLDNDYYHLDEVSLCPECDEYYLEYSGRHSKLTGEYYCCEYCKEKAEERYREEHDIEEAA